MTHQLTAVVALTLLSCASSAALAQANQQKDSGWYITGAAGRSTTDFNNSDYTLATAGINETTDRTGTTYRLMVGHSFDRNWALEGAYTSLGEPKRKYTGTVGAITGAGEAKLKNDAWSLAIKGTMPLNQQFDIFGRFGWTYNRAELSASSSARWAGTVFAANPAFTASKNRSDVLVGVGAEFKPQKNLGIRVEYDHYGRFGSQFFTTSNVGRSDTSAWLLGLAVRF